MTTPAGVPPLADPTIVWNDVAPVTSDGADVVNSSATPQWGIFSQDGDPVLTGDSTLAFEIDQDASVTNYPIEDGGFESYNKVQTPFRLKFTFTKGGTTSDRAAFLKKLDDLQASLDEFVGVTPEITYQVITIDHYDLRRTSRNGVTLLTVDVWCQEVRTGSPAQFSNTTPGATQLTATKDPEAQDPINGGTVQGATPASQTSVRATPQGPPGSIQGALTAPATITAPLVSLTRSAGNVVPAALGSAVRSAITYVVPTGPASGVISGVVLGSIGQPTGYELYASAVVPVNEVTNILPPGFTVVQ